MNTAPPVRIGVLGYGYWGPNIVRTVRDLAETELVVCCDANPKRLREAQKQFGVPVTDSWQEVLSDPTIEAVVIATPASTHCDLTLASIASDTHTLVEKPFAMSSDEAEVMYAAADRRGLALEAGHIFLHNPAVRALASEVAAGTLGEPRTAFAVRASHGPRARNDVDIVFDCMVHDVYILQEILGPAVEVSANGACFLTPGIADSASARITFEGGAQAFCYASWCEPVKTRRLTLVGSKAMADYDDLRDEPVRILQAGYEPFEGGDGFGNVGLRRFNRGTAVLSVQPEEPLRLELAAFAARVRGRPSDPLISPSSVMAVLRTLEAIERSMRRGGAPERIGAREQ